MSILVDLFMNTVPYLPGPFIWWLYKPERTLRYVKAEILARQGSVEVWCDKEQARFRLWVQFTNDNAFPVEIDRVIASGNLHAAHLEASNLMGTNLRKGQSASLLLEGRIDDVNLERVNRSPDDQALQLTLRAVVANKYHTMREYTIGFSSLMCRLCNKRAGNPDV
jgi:hypothetical protein